MTFQFWDFSTSSNAFDTMQKQPFPTNVSSYFRRPSKVVKPNSRNNSPRTSSRRRMTTSGHVPVRTRSVVDQQRMSAPQLSDHASMSSRPISWHPNMLDEMSQFHFANEGVGDGFMATPYTTAEINGLVTPMSYPVMDEPQIQELITPLEGLSANETESGYAYGQDFDMTQYWLSQQAKDSAIDFDPSFYPMMNYQPWYDASQYTVPNLPTAPTSPSFLPIPDFGAPLHVDMPEPEPEPEHEEPEDDSEELVAMGLYDSPADVQSSSLLFGGFTGTVKRKSLVLEDSFEPSPNDEEDGDDNDDDDDENNEEDNDDDDAVAEEGDDEQPGVSPVVIDETRQILTGASAAATQYVPGMDNNYNMNQWQASTQNSYTWV